MKSFSPLFLAVLLCTTLISPVAAETRYVSDLLVVTVRDQKGDQYKTLETILTATPVEILEEDKTYVKVRTPKGTEGYVRKQYITKELPKNLQIEQLQAEVLDLRQKLEEIQQNSQQSIADASQHQSRVETLTSQLEQSQEELNAVKLKYEELSKNSENVLNLTAENEQLIEQNGLINSELLMLREENQNFHRSNMIQWFIAGAGVFFFGWLIGKISRKKQRGFSRL
ncbi:MAG: TIGR04211 family SH3 domain-containing protein [Desulfuromonadales bacterium]|nr:TIGR04211 family SH3 domain-containing protein [Desulfuromonadales bacterium]MBN2791097.1 TIGR04211 family SH3 domain-containing protein [Desulfuromonadales bacterium]